MCLTDNKQVAKNEQKERANNYASISDVKIKFEYVIYDCCAD